MIPTSHDRIGNYVRYLVRYVAEMRPDQRDVNALAVPLARARAEAIRTHGTTTYATFDVAVRERFGAAMPAVFEASAATAEAAEAEVRRLASWPKEIVEHRVEPAGRCELALHAFTEEDARNHLLYLAPKDGTLVSFECVTPPKRGFLGIGRRRGTWRAVHDAPFRAHLIVAR